MCVICNMCALIKTFSHTIFSHHNLSFNTQDHNDRHIQQASPFRQYQMTLGIQLYLNCRPLVWTRTESQLTGRS